ncbi:MAG: S8 family serine peptidase, partial [Bacteroidota bacterium]
FLLIILVCFVQNVYSQEKSWVFFTDKKEVEFNPYEYFDEKTIERRKQQGIPLNQHTDLPVNKNYLGDVARISGRPISVSRWLNAALVDCSRKERQQLNKLAHVEKIQPVAEREVQLNYDTVLISENEDILNGQLSRFGDSLFTMSGYNGEGIRIAVLDAGFPEVDTSPFFQHLFEEDRIIETYDFVQDEKDVYSHSSHGTMVLSCIAGRYEDKQTGLATGAEFLLGRTEKAFTESIAEEENWFEAMEWADKNGADIISSSLGYSYHRYFKQEMDGKTSLVSKAANIAAKKGMLVVASMGNEGTSRWQVLVTPADADSVLSVGGISPSSGIHTPFSSFGPTSDKRLKPNVTAFGHVITAGKKELASSRGTSFSAPLVTGFAACVWQKYPEWDNIKLKEEISNSGDLFPYFDYAHGYGVPQASYFFERKAAAGEDSVANTSLDINFKGDNITIKIAEKDVDQLSSNYPQLFYHVEHPGNYLQKFGVAELEKGETLKIKNKEEYSGSVFRAYFKDRINEQKIP